MKIKEGKTMKDYIIRRLLQMIPVFILLILLLFLIVELAPGDFVSGMINPRMTAEQKDALREALGENRPFYVKFWNWLKEAVKGNLGYSQMYKKPVTEVIGSLLGSTFNLAILSMIVSILIGIPTGILSATKQYSILDNSLTVVSLIGISLPAFFFGLLVIKALAVDLQWFPIFGIQNHLLKTDNKFTIFLDKAWHLVLPVTVLGMSSAASFMRYTRTSMLEVIRQDYIRTARSKGLKEKVVIYRHAFRNAMIPIITLIGFWIPSLLSGAVMTETVFGLPGMGRVMVDAALKRDTQLVVGINGMLALLTLIAAIIADILYAVVDPRVKYD